MRYDDAVVTLFQGPLDTFVAERKRLATEIKAGGDKAAAVRLDKLARPTMSAWAVNQLWWHARADFDALLASAGRLRQGDMSALGSHRDATAKLRERAAVILTAAGHGATEATLRRVTSTLHALAAAGGFAPDPDGALTADRDPPGFDAAGFGGAASASRSNDVVAIKPKVVTTTEAKRAIQPETETKAKGKTETDTNAKSDAEAREIAAAAERERAATDRARQNALREQREAERRELQAGLRIAKSEVATATSEIARLREALTAAEDRRTRAEAKRDALDVQLVALVGSETKG